MKNRIYNILAASLLTLGLLAGCSSLTPMEATQKAGDDTRALIREQVADEGRANQMIALVDQLEKDLMAYVDIQAAHEEVLRVKNADYDTSHAEMQRLYDAYNRDTRGLGMKIMQTDLAMKKLATPAEWAVISKPKHRIGGF